MQNIIENAEKQNLLYSAYNKNFDNNSVKRLSLLLGTMKEALMADELILFLQPKVAIATGKIVGAEALIRWRLQKNKSAKENKPWIGQRLHATAHQTCKPGRSCCAS